jgi:predicted ABC-type ATPase
LAVRQCRRDSSILGRNKKIGDQGGSCNVVEVDRLVEANIDFALETTLATLGYARKIPGWQRIGYSVGLIYLRLQSEAVAIERVKRRVALGGHGIPEQVIRRRFLRSRAYFEAIYKLLVDEWYIFDSLEGKFVERARWKTGTPEST